MQMGALKAGFISRSVQAYFVFFAGLLLTFSLQRLHWPVRERGFEEMTLDSRPNLIELLREANAERSPFARMSWPEPRFFQVPWWRRKMWPRSNTR